MDKKWFADFAKKYVQWANPTKDLKTPPPLTDALSDTEKEKEAVKTIFDDTINQRPIPLNEFLSLCHRRPYETNDMSIEEKMFWNYPRRWKVVIFGVTLQNLLKDDLTAFLEFQIGTDRVEYKVEVDGEVAILATGDVPIRERTAIINHIAQSDKNPYAIRFRYTGEWRGSYADLKTRRLKIVAWRFRRFKLNALEAIREEPLINFAGANVHVSRLMYKCTEGRRIPRCRIRFQLEFQEIYDFELLFLEWAVSDLNGVGIQTFRLKFSGRGAMSGAELASNLVRGSEPQWPNLGTVHWRGCSMEMDESSFAVELLECNEKTPPRLLGKGLIRLHGVLNSHHRRCELSMNNVLCGTLKGRVSFFRSPLYQQTGQYRRFDDEHIYVVVHIVDVDRIYTYTTNEYNINETETFVAATYRGRSRHSCLVRHSGRCEFEEDLIIPIPKTELGFIRDDPLVWIDVWSKHEDIFEHAGYCCACLYNIYEDTNGIERPLVEQKFFDRNLMKNRTFQTRKYFGHEGLAHLFTINAVSTINYELFALPDITHVLRDTVKRSVVSEDVDTFHLSQAVAAATQAWPGVRDRNFQATVKTHRNQTVYINRCLTPIVPPTGVDSERHLFTFIRSIPFCAPLANDAVELPDFVIVAKAGSIKAHILFHASLLLGINTKPAVCIGTLKNGQPHWWTMKWFWDEPNLSGDVIFWEMTTGMTYRICHCMRDRDVPTQYMEESHPNIERRDSNRCCKSHQADLMEIHIEEKPMPGLEPLPIEEREFIELPYRTLDIICSPDGIFVNLQNPDPRYIWYDVWNPQLWYPLINSDVGCKMKRAFDPLPLGPPLSQPELIALEGKYADQMKFDISLYRTSRNLTTTWNKQPTLQDFLLRGLKLRQALDTAHTKDVDFLESEMKNWRHLLSTKVPPLYKVQGSFFKFPALKSRSISAQLVQCACSMIEDRSKLSLLGLAVACMGFPNQFTSVSVVLIIASRISEVEKRALRDAMQAAASPLTDEVVASKIDKMDSLRRSSEESAKFSFKEDVERDTPEDIDTPENIDWSSIYEEIRNLNPTDYDRLVHYFTTEDGLDDDEARYWAAYYVRELSMHNNDHP